MEVIEEILEGMLPGSGKLGYDPAQEVFLIELLSPDFTLWKRPTKKASPNIILENFWTSKTVTAVSKIDRSFRTYF